jgi:hypothetical protein
MGLIETQIILVGGLFFWIALFLAFAKTTFKIISFFVSAYYLILLMTIQVAWFDSTKEQFIALLNQILMLNLWGFGALLLLFIIYGVWWALDTSAHLKDPFSKKRFNNFFNPFKETEKINNGSDEVEVSNE